MCKLTTDKVDEYIKNMIVFHGYSSNILGSYNCYVSYPAPFPISEGMFLWKRSAAFNRIETSIQMYFMTSKQFNSTSPNVFKLSGMTFDKFVELMMHLIREYLIEFKEINTNYKELGAGIKLFDDNSNFKNIGIALDHFDCQSLKKLEIFTINNSIVKALEKLSLFKVLNPDKILIYDYCSELSNESEKHE